MSVSTPASPRASRPRRFVPRFSLAAALLTITLCAIGLGYWYRVPFEVVHQVDEYRWEVASVRRTWGGTVRHGPRRVFSGKLRLLENYRDGVRHGKQEWFDAKENAYITAEFQRGRLVAFQASDDYDQRLARHLAEGTIDNPRIERELNNPALIEFIETPLKDAIQLLAEAHGIPMTCQGLNHNVTLAEPRSTPRPPSEVVRLNDQMQLLVPLDPAVPDTAIELQMLPVAEHTPQRPRVISAMNLPITCEVRDEPLIVALGKMLKPHDLVCDCRYGMIWVVKRDDAERWRDPTGVSEMVPGSRSKAAAIWNLNSVAELIEAPVRTACEIHKRNHNGGFEFDWSKVPEDYQQGRIPGSRVTINVEHVPYRHVLGAILDRAHCQAHLDGETIVIELQPDHPLAQTR